ncbi:hypothetical protein K2173_018364 [Erythroxylum novogranatense]|uniref:Uncharacterized protein n=1 Tax=Erythroxylum novogranatense TaxID=1862640 RepID=A0AAV8UAE0_9ROSI|nr:hypothetical protein K2173_018364 [Erythroxylum novogranatense]
MAGKGDGEIGFDEGLSFLPSHILDEAIWDNKEYVKQRQHHHQCRHLPRFPLQTQQLPSKCNPRHNGRRRFLDSNWASGEQGMQVIFLDTTHKRESGTGVFLPQTQRAGTNFQYNKKPTCSRVLLPARVVQALNLNVHELGLEISRRQDFMNSSKSREFYSVKNKNTKSIARQYSALPLNENTSPELFLPKEWTY